MPRQKLSPVVTVCVLCLVPIAVPITFVLVLWLSAKEIDAQELGPKQAYVPPQRAEAPLTSDSFSRRPGDVRVRNRDVAQPPQKPAGKMALAPTSPAPHGRNTTVVRRSTPAVSASVVAKARPVVPTSPPSAISERPALVSKTGSDLVAPEPEPTRDDQPERSDTIASTPPRVRNNDGDFRANDVADVATQTDPQREPGQTLPDDQDSGHREASALVDAVEPSTESRDKLRSTVFEAPAQLRERTQPPTLPLEKTFEEPIVSAPPTPIRTLEEDTSEATAHEVAEHEAEMPQQQPARDVAPLLFEDESDDDETMELVEQPAPLAPRHSVAVQNVAVQNVAAQSDPLTVVAKRADAQQPSPPGVEETTGPSTAIMADLKPVRTIEIRKAIEVPPLAEMDNPQLRQPADQALTILRQRRPLNFWPIYRDPWLANRDSYPFRHYPLWFEDPNLERCGRGCGHFTTTVSAVRFAANLPILPYRMTAEPACRCVRTLPDCTVCEKFACDAYLPPWSWSAAAVQAAATVGCIYVIP